MNCSNCGFPIPEGATYCPRCGALSTTSYGPGGATPADPTVASSPDIPPPPPSTSYGEPAYGTGQSNPYNTPSSGVDLSNPYNTPSSPYSPYGYVPPSSPQPPSPAPAPRGRGNRMLLFIIPLLVVILVLGGVLALVLHSKTSGNSSQNATTPTPALSASQMTATAQANLTATASANLTATAQANLTATASVIAANPNPYASGGTLAMLDPLTDNSRGFGWPQSNSADGSCNFKTGGYQVNSAKTQFFYFCTSASNSYSNFTFEVQVQIIMGDCGGLIFRADSNAGKLYLFEVCTDGSYNLYLYRNLSGDSSLLANASSPAIKSGLNQVNVLAVTAQGSTLTLYVNGQKLTSLTNSTYSQGEVGMVADSNNDTTGVIFSKARLWTF
jgi:eukaryotic-like serine/threonine-protein kinase